MKCLLWILILIFQSTPTLSGASPLNSFFELAQSFEKKGAWEEAAKQYRIFLALPQLSFDQKIEGQFHLARTLNILGQKEESRRTFENVDALYSQRAGATLSEETKAYVARARFLLNDEAFGQATATYQDASFPLTQFLKQREDAIKILQQGYEKVISLGDPEWAMASYFNLGLANERAAATILNAPWPKDLTTTQREEFFITLQNRGLPYEDHAIIMYQKVLSFERTSPKNGKEWISLAKAHLKKLMP